MGAVSAGRGRVTGSQRGASLLLVLVFVVVGAMLTVAVLAFARTSFLTGTAYQERDLERSRDRDALEYLVQSIRPNLSQGIQGDTRTATVAGVTATCTGETGSGQTSGAGRTDRVITCSTPLINARYRIFDRSGDRPGIIVETLSFTTLG